MWVTCECEIMSTLHRLNSHTTKNSVRIFSHGVRIKYILSQKSFHFEFPKICVSMT